MGRVEPARSGLLPSSLICCQAPTFEALGSSLQRSIIICVEMSDVEEKVMILAVLFFLQCIWIRVDGCRGDPIQERLLLPIPDKHHTIQPAQTRKRMESKRRHAANFHSESFLRGTVSVNDLA